MFTTHITCLSQSHTYLSLLAPVLFSNDISVCRILTLLFGGNDFDIPSFRSRAQRKSLEDPIRAQLVWVRIRWMEHLGVSLSKSYNVTLVLLLWGVHLGRASGFVAPVIYNSSLYYNAESGLSPGWDQRCEPCLHEVWGLLGGRRSLQGQFIEVTTEDHMPQPPPFKLQDNEGSRDTLS